MPLKFPDPPPADRLDYAVIRPLFGGRLSQSRVDGCEALRKATLGLPLPQRAYLIATVFHETARTMRPITEIGERSYFAKYEPGTRIGAGLGNTIPGDGWRYRGRGYVQITGRRNYALAGGKLGLNLIGDPDLALQPLVAARILIEGCREGWFTSRRLADYLTGIPPDYVGARRVINGTDRARDIAGYAVTFEAALR